MAGDAWRPALLAITIGGTAVGYGWMLLSAPAPVRASLLWLTGTFVVVALGLAWISRAHLDARTVSSNAALGSIVHVAAAGAVVAAHHLWHGGLEGSWGYFALGTLGTVAAFGSWSRGKASPRASRRAAPAPSPHEPPPSTGEHLEQEPDWEALAAVLDERGDAVRARQLAALRRVASALDADGTENDRVHSATLVLRQEVFRLRNEAVASGQGVDDDDLLTQAASFFEWGAQKLPELVELDIEDLLLAQVVAEIRALKSRVDHVYVDHTELVPIHPIDRATAEEKCAQRVEALRAARPLLESNGMVLSEDLIAAHPELSIMASVTGFQVVSLGEEEGYVTFEGNGRAFALLRAFPGETVQVEVRRFSFDDPDRHARVARHVQRVRRANGIAANDAGSS